jgi:hypothetical protein
MAAVTRRTWGLTATLSIGVTLAALTAADGQNPEAKPQPTKPTLSGAPRLSGGAAPTATPSPTGRPAVTAPKATPTPTGKPSATPPASKPAASPTASKPGAAPSATRPAPNTTTTPAETKPAETKPAAPTKPAGAAEKALVKQVRDAKSQFQPVTDEDVAAAKARLMPAVAQLNAYFASMGEWGTSWQDYLRWASLETELKKQSGYDPAALLAVHRRFSGGFVGLEEPEFVAVADALEEFADSVDAAQNKNLKTETGDRLEKLAVALEEIGGDAPTAAQSAAIGAEVAWLRSHGQADAVATVVTRKYSQPNLLLDVDGAFVHDALGNPIDETAPVVDCILGTSINGTGRTLGEFNVGLVPNDLQAQLGVLIDSVNYSNTIGRNRSAVLYNTGATNLHATTNLFINETGFTAGSIAAAAKVNSRINCITSTRGGLLGRIVVRVASKKAPKQKPQADAIAGQHARQKLHSSVRDRMADLLSKANDQFESKLRKPLVRFDGYPRVLRFSTTADALRLRVQQDVGGRLAATSAPPAAAKTPIALRVHESLLGNSTQNMLAGRKFDQQRVQLLAEGILGEVPENLKPDPEEEPFSITFADLDPVTFAFDDDTITFTVRGKGFTLGDKKYNGMDISGRYKIAADGNGLKAARDGDFRITPPGFVSGGARRLSVGDTVIKSVLQKKFAKILPAEVVRTGTPLEGDFSKLGVVYVSTAKAEDGWLVVGIDHKDEGKSTAAPAKSAAGTAQPADHLAEAGGQ